MIVYTVASINFDKSRNHTSQLRCFTYLHPIPPKPPSSLFQNGSNKMNIGQPPRRTQNNHIKQYKLVTNETFTHIKFSSSTRLFSPPQHQKIFYPTSQYLTHLNITFQLYYHKKVLFSTTLQKLVAAPNHISTIRQVFLLGYSLQAKFGSPSTRQSTLINGKGKKGTKFLSFLAFKELKERCKTYWKVFNLSF